MPPFTKETGLCPHRVKPTLGVIKWQLDLSLEQDRDTCTQKCEKHNSRLSYTNQCSYIMLPATSIPPAVEWASFHFEYFRIEKRKGSIVRVQNRHTYTHTFQKHMLHSSISLVFMSCQYNGEDSALSLNQIWNENASSVQSDKGCILLGLQPEQKKCTKTNTHLHKCH